MVWLRSALAALVLAALIATTVAAVMARGAMAADGQLCSLTGTSTVVLAADGLPLFDGDGEPVMMDQVLCPDAILKGLALIDSADGAQPIAIEMGMLTTSDRALLAGVEWRMGGLGRGPPRAA